MSSRRPNRQHAGGFGDRASRDPGSKTKPCFDFLRHGRCRYGNSCKFSHVAPNGDEPPEQARQRHQDESVDRIKDKLRSWKAMIRPLDNTLSRNGAPLHPSTQQVSRFFELGLELMDGDVGATQDAVRSLATDPGLSYIKAITDGHIQDAVTPQDKANVWTAEICPFFRLITHPHVVDSNLLEQSVAVIYNFLAGPNASRLSRLFDFILHLSASWPNIKTSNPSPLAALDLSLAVLSRVIDCSTTIILNNDVQRIVGQFSALLGATHSGPDDFSSLQATKYMEYLKRRFGVAKDMTGPQPPGKSTVKQEDFKLRRDLPGTLSADGPRHDNDHADISKILIMPTYEEVMTTRSEYLPTTDSSQWHLKGIRGRLDREFRLLREDTIGQLRDAVREFREQLRSPDQKNRNRPQNGARTTAYDKATVQAVAIDRNKGMELTVKCSQPEAVRRMEDLERRAWWEQSKRLRPGALVCVLDAASMLQFYVVAESTLRAGDINDRDQQQHQVNQESRQPDSHKAFSLSGSRDYLYVKLSFVDTAQYEIRCALQWYCDLRSHPQRYLVEFPGVLLASFKHTLEALQQLSEKPDLPFADLIAPEKPSSGAEIVLSPPLFARSRGFEFDLSSLTHDYEAFSVDLKKLPSPAQVSSRTGLDMTQSEALMNTLSRELSLIQGPPGTGKSYTGEKIIQALLANKEKARLGPIICVCYTNHALDQLLEHLLDSGIDGIIRIGSRSKSERLENLNLRVVSQEAEFTKQEKTETYRLWKTMRDSSSRAGELLSELSSCDSLDSIKEYLLYYNPEHHDEMFQEGVADEDGYKVVQRQPRNVIRHWLQTGPRTQVKQRELAELHKTSLHQMTMSERQDLYRHWLKSIRDALMAKMIEVNEEHRQAKEQRDRVHQEVRLRCLQQAQIIGVTTTGMARDLGILRKLRTKVVVCEEAGEVLEAHVLTALLPSVEQAILIGDHQQLRPQIQNYELQSTNPRGAQYSLDVSLFERLVQPPHETDIRVPVSVLDTQRRMHPSIAEMIRSTLYSSLKDADNVKNYPEVVGMKRRLFWFHHENLEAGAQDSDPQNTSHFNTFEIEMTAALVSHLVRQGRYSPEDIAVLTPYLGQLHKLRARMSMESTFAVNVGDRDLEKLKVEGMEAETSDRHSDSNKQEISKTTVLRSVRLATIDNFQGEEAKVVVISLVRSNPQNRCGFLGTSNRINVLMSRAKHGCYIIGNSKTYSKVPMWNQLIQLLKDGGNFGTSLELQCSRHPETPISVSKLDDFAIYSPDGGCALPCDKRLDCGHACYVRCHSNLLHKTVKCHEKCPRPKTGCDHACPRECGDPCEQKCNVLLYDINLRLPCGHILPSAKCWQAQNPADVVCDEMTKKKVPGCEHIVEVRCPVKVTVFDFKCETECGASLACGHTCRSPCHRCNERKANDLKGVVVETKHEACKQVCGRNYTTCPHACQHTCHGETACEPCRQPCEVRCSHSRCDKACHEPCAPCAEETCASRCPHTACSMPCAAPCDWIPCSKRCTSVLVCGHQCPSLCGEGCPDAKYCQKCASDKTLSTVVEYLLLTEYKDIDLDEDPCIFADCGHFFAKSSMDRHMSVEVHYEIDKKGNPVGIRAASKPFSMDEVKVCPQCRGSLRNISRYGRIVRRAMLDEATKKFISWSNDQNLLLSERLLQEQQRLEQRTGGVTEQIGRPGLLDLSGPMHTQLSNLRKFVGGSRYEGVCTLFKDIKQYLHKVKVEEQPFQKVSNFVRHANRNKPSGPFSFDESVIQLRGYLLAISLLLKCNVAILADFLNLKRGAALVRTEIKVKFAENVTWCEKLVNLAIETDRPQFQAEGHVYSAQLCGLALAILGTPPPRTDHPIPGVFSTTEAPSKEAQWSRIEALRDTGLSHVDQARSVLASRSWPNKQLTEAELDAAQNLLNDGVFYRPVTAEELREVYAAMAKEFRGTGHWYTCERGHPFTVGECGMPMEMARCTECDSPVGGLNHMPVEGVRHAQEMEALAGGVDGMQMGA